MTVKFSIEYVGEVSASAMDEWRVTIGSDAIMETFEVFTGFATREPITGTNPHTKFSCAYHEWDRRNLAEPVPPTEEEVLAALVYDARAVNYTFYFWAGIWGFNPDSRKALGTYNRCLDTAAKLRRCLGDDHAAIKCLQHIK